MIGQYWPDKSPNQVMAERRMMDKNGFVDHIRQAPNNPSMVTQAEIDAGVNAISEFSSTRNLLLELTEDSIKELAIETLTAALNARQR